MPIILEGADFTGKSTYLKHITENALDDKVIHNKGRDSETATYYTNLIHNGMNMDRSFYGELVYSKVFNRKPKLTLKEVKALHKLALLYDYEIQVRLPAYPLENYLDMCKQRGDNGGQTVTQYLASVLLWYCLAKEFGLCIKLFGVREYVSKNYYENYFKKLTSKYEWRDLKK